ncbi:MAG: YqhA family protein, partial [Silvanigrellaceae bacterium]|nr:YqhA family protein [Silvanigrellaceae bacterium]
MMQKFAKKFEYLIEYNIFASRWLQAPLYLGLIIAQIAYTIKFLHTLYHALAEAAAVLDFGGEISKLFNKINLQQVRHAVKTNQQLIFATLFHTLDE